MIVRILWIAAALGVAVFALWHPASQPALQTVAVPSSPELPARGAAGASRYERGHRGHARRDETNAELVVYVAGAVRKPGLYHLHPGDRGAAAVARAGGFLASADAAAVNLAARAEDGDEIFVPVAGESAYPRTRTRAGRRRSATPPPSQSIDVNTAGVEQLARVPGFGRAIAQRIVELRGREGSYASLDELLDVAGMTQTRLERARPFLESP